MADASDYAAYEAAYEAGRPVLLDLTLVADLETPVAAFLKLRACHPGPAFLLESVEGGVVRGRYSMIGLDPDLAWRCRDGRAALARGNLADFADEDRAPLDSLRALIAESAIVEREGPELPPMAAGLFGYLGYDMVSAHGAPRAEPKPDPIGVPEALPRSVRRVMVVFDGARDEMSIGGLPVASGRPEFRPAPLMRAPCSPASTPIGRRARSAARSHQRRIAGRSPLVRAGRGESRIPRRRTSTRRWSPGRRTYIAAGDAFQIVLSQRFDEPLRPCRRSPSIGR